MSDLVSDNRLEQPSLDLYITEIGLSTRATNVLVNAGIDTVGDALAALGRGDQALTSLKGFGSKSLADLKKRLQEQGFSLLDRVEMPPAGMEPEGVVEIAAEVPEELEVAPPPVIEPEPEPVSAPAAAAVLPQETAPEAPLSLGQRVSATMVQARDQIRFGAWVYGVIGLVIIVALLLPPVSLLNRLGITGYDALDAGHSSISHPDGVTLSVNPDTFGGRLRLKIASVPRQELVEGSAGRDLRRAVEALPSHLVVKSPLYQFKVRGDSTDTVMIDVLVPNEAEPWETLDLYAWTGKEWQWVGGKLHDEAVGHEFVRAYVEQMPSSIVVVQTEALAPQIAVLMEEESLTAGALSVINDVNPTGLLLGTDGALLGDMGGLLQSGAGMPYAVLPALRNWAAGGSVNRGLLSDLLALSEIRETHIENLVALCSEREFAGVVVDYRGVGVEERDAYTSFIEELAAALHQVGLRLGVTVEGPVATGSGWDTGGYDWASLGRAADELRIPFPADPTAYADGGDVQRLLVWATEQVARHKLRMEVSSLSAEQSVSGVRYIPLEEALAPFGSILVRDGISEVESGGEVEFGLSGEVRGITPLESAGTYRLEYGTGDQGTRTVWLGTATNLATKLELARRYRLGGVVVADLLDAGNEPGVEEALAAYSGSGTVPSSQPVEVVWSVTSPGAMVDQQVSPLTEPGYTWKVLAAVGEYTVRATVGGFDHGQVSIRVADPQPEVTEVVTPTAQITETASLTGTAIGGGPDSAVVAECLNAIYVADVSIPDDTQFDHGEEFEKTWRVRNSGTCPWPEDTVLAFSQGSQMDAPDTVAVGAVEPGEVVEVTAKMKSPADAGRYTGVWKMKTTAGFFGGPLTVVIRAGEAT
ncbi:MAG TPA: hypothetical protein ENN99_05515, partial [Chloroflexi bacterium]|nr:hypothetical protein [Chloroflexota bacterium]